jgi:hypothetical protein
MAVMTEEMREVVNDIDRSEVTGTEQRGEEMD